MKRIVIAVAVGTIVLVCRGWAPAHAQSAYAFCPIQSAQTQTVLMAYEWHRGGSTALDSETCAALATALSQNGAQFSTTTPDSFRPPGLATAICEVSTQTWGLPAEGTSDIIVFDPGASAESAALCHAFQDAGLVLEPSVHWAQICRQIATSPTTTQAIAAVMTCPNVSPIG
jgi:hypothetical protein